MTTAPSQLSLFPADPSPVLPDGLTYREDYMAGRDADGLLAAVDASAWLADLKRRVQHYGYRYDYKARQARREDRIGPLPDFLKGVAKRLACEGVFSKPPDQVIVNEYLPGQGISAHIDCRPCFGETIAILSLGSACVMRFEHHPSSRTVELALQPLSLLTIWGHPSVTVTPHIASETRPDTASEVIAENIRRGEAGEPFLHLVDRDLGY